MPTLMSDFPTSAPLRRLYLSLCAAFLVVSAASLTLSAQRDLVSFGLQFALMLMFALGLYGRLPMGYSVGPREIVVKKMLFRQKIPLSKITVIEFCDGGPSFFERLFGCRRIILRLQREDSMELYSSESEALARALQQAIGKTREGGQVQSA